jgi:hypothetical protein
LAKLGKSVGGLRLGMSKRNFVAAVGTPVQLVDEFETATFTRTELLERRAGQAEADTLFTTILVRGRFEEGQLVEYSVVKSAST